MSPRPGSVVWLLHHEFRLYWRGLNRKFGRNKFLILMLILLHLFAWPLAFGVKHMPPLPPAALASMLTIAGSFILLVMTSRGVILTVQAFFARGDMDLMLSSPLLPRTLTTVRTLAIATTLTCEFALLIWPFADVFLLFGLFGALKCYVLLPACGLLATSISLGVALLLVHAFGARRTRVIAQVLSAFIAISFTVIFQIPNMMARSGDRRRAYDAHAFTQYALAANSGLWAPARALLNGLLPSLALGAACALVFWLTTRRLSGSFISASIASAGASAAGSGAAGRVTSQTREGRLRFIDNLHVIVIRKELRSIFRDPWLLSQILQQCFVALPLVFVLWHHDGRGQPLAWGTLIVVTGNIASALAWLTATAEDAPEMLAASPIARGYFVRTKLVAALLPTVPIALAPLLLLESSHAWFGFSTSVCAAGSALTCALLNVRAQPPAQRRDFRQRLRGNSGRAFLELGAVGIWFAAWSLMVWLGPSQ